MNKSSLDLKAILTQFILIVFSVVLGLYLSERIEERKQRRAAQELLAKIKLEVQDNILLLEEVLPYHREIYRNLDSLSQDAVFTAEFIIEKSILFKKLLTKGTFMGRYPASDAWDIAKSHPLIMNIDYDKLLILSRIYNQQKMTFEPLDDLLDILNSKEVNSAKDAKSNLELMAHRMYELVARERQLMHYYQQSEAIIELPNKG